MDRLLPVVVFGEARHLSSPTNMSSNDMNEDGPLAWAPNLGTGCPTFKDSRVVPQRSYPYIGFPNFALV